MVHARRLVRRHYARVARRLSADGMLFMQDLSPNMVHTCVRRMAEHDRKLIVDLGMRIALRQ